MRVPRFDASLRKHVPVTVKQQVIRPPTCQMAAFDESRVRSSIDQSSGRCGHLLLIEAPGGGLIVFDPPGRRHIRS